MADPSDLLIDRTLVLLRHSKAVPPESMPDFERPLADRGRADARAAGRYLVAEGIEADLVLCSPSQRTRETWEYAAEAGATANDVWYDRRIYNADTPSGSSSARSTRPQAWPSSISPAAGPISALMTPTWCPSSYLAAKAASSSCC